MLGGTVSGCEKGGSGKATPSLEEEFEILEFKIFNWFFLLSFFSFSDSF